MTGPCEYCGHQTFEVTAYTAGPESTGKRPGDPGYGITASGAPVRENRTLACPPEMAFGTRVYIPYFDETFVCEDRGGAIKGRRLDVYMESVEDALEFGRGLSTDDEPDLWRRGLTGEVVDWIEVGLPDERRLRRACGRAEQVLALTYGGRVARTWWEQNEAQLRKQAKLTVVDLPAEATQALAARVARTMQISCTLQEGELWLDVDGTTLHVVPEIRQGQRAGLPGR